MRSRNGRFVDNPGDPQNWSNSYTQYISEAAWRSYQIHGGQPAIVGNLARYAEQDVKGQLSFYDHDNDPRWGTWPNTGQQWAQLTWASAQTIRSAEVYFFDDNGGVRLPASWRLQYWNGSAFVDVPSPSGYPTVINQYNRVTFASVTTTQLRIVLQSGQASVGLLEVKAFG
jgi:hypothetical protein